MDVPFNEQKAQSLHGDHDMDEKRTIQTIVLGDIDHRKSHTG